jgi:hypothetical protein
MLMTVCAGTFTVYEIDPVAGGGHLEVGHKFDIKGPLPWIGVYRVKPVASKSASGKQHPWAAQPFFAFPESGVPGWSRIKGIVVAPHGKEPHRAHAYNMEVEDWDDEDCPTKINFSPREHETGSSGAGGLHPGHASTGKD